MLSRRSLLKALSAVPLLSFLGFKPAISDPIPDELPPLKPEEPRGIINAQLEITDKNGKVLIDGPVFFNHYPDRLEKNDELTGSFKALADGEMERYTLSIHEGQNFMLGAPVKVYGHVALGLSVYNPEPINPILVSTRLIMEGSNLYIDHMEITGI